MRFDGWTEHFRYDLWMKAFEAEGIPKESYLRAYDLDEILPWDVLDVSIKKRWLQIELIKAKKEMRTEDCKWGHCYACGVPGNGTDTVLAKADAGLLAHLRRHAVETCAEDPASYRDVAKGAAYRQKAMPDLAPAVRIRGTQGTEVFRHRVTFAKTGDARFLSHRNTMDVFERAIRAAGLPARYSEGFNPHMKLSMGPALPLGLESLPRGLRRRGPLAVSRRRGRGDRIEAASRTSTSSRCASSPRASPRCPRPSRPPGTPSASIPPSTSAARATPSPTAGARRCPALNALSLETDADGGSRLLFEVNLDQSERRDHDAEKGPRGAALDPAARAGVALGDPRSHRSRLMPYRVTVTARFEAAHNLIDYEGGPEPLHGHSYRVEAVLESEKLQQYDVAVDFVPAKKALEALARQFDYRYINEHPDFAGRNTSAENLARWFNDRLEISGALGHARVVEVTVWEGPENRATYAPTA